MSDKKIKGANKDDYKTRFINGFKLLSRSRNPYEVWNDCMTMFAISICNQTTLFYKKDEHLRSIWQKREDEYLRTIRKYSEHEQKYFPKMFAFLVEEFEKDADRDLLGSIFMELGIANKNAGQFFTPYNVCSCMTKVLIDKKLKKTVKKNGYATICDPACGAGATLISAANYCKIFFKSHNYQNHILFYAQDIDKLCCLMCYIQLTFLGVAAIVVNANTLTKPKVDFNADAELIYFTPIYFSQVWAYRRLFHNLDIMSNKIEVHNNDS